MTSRELSPVAHDTAHRSLHAAIVRTSEFNEEMAEEVMKKIMASNDANQISLSQMAEYLCVSPRTLSRRLHKMGMCYRELAKIVKLSQAHYYLQDTNMRIHEVAKKMGYSDSSNFSKAFKLWSGVTPKSVRGQRH